MEHSGVQTSVSPMAIAPYAMAVRTLLKDKTPVELGRKGRVDRRQIALLAQGSAMASLFSSRPGAL